MRKLTDMRFFQVLKYPSGTQADMQKIEEYYEEFIEVLFHTSKTPNDLIDFYNQQCYVRVELKDLINDLDYIDQNLAKNKCIKKALELLEMQLSLTESRLKPSFENYTQQTSTNSNLNPKIKWTGSNVELVELGYAMLATRSINDGYIGINEIMDFLCSVFDFPVKDYYHVYHTIKQRAGDRTIYLDKMKDRLMNKMDNDENKK
jgi:hypothetical protein